MTLAASSHDLVALFQLALVGAMVLLLLAVRPPVRSVTIARLQRWCTALGASLIVLVSGLELRRLLRTTCAGPRAAAPIQGIATGGTAGQPAQLQVLVAVRPDASATQSDALYEVLAPVPADANQPIAVEVKQLHLAASFTLEQEHRRTILHYDIELGRAPSAPCSGKLKLEQAGIDLGDGRPFVVIPLVVDSHCKWFSLLRSDPQFIAVLVRALRVDDVLTPLPGATVHEGVASVLPRETAPTSTRSALVRLIDNTQGTGIPLLLLGVLLLCAPRLSKIQSLAGTLLVCVLVISALARIRFACELRQLDDANPIARARAVVRVARSSLFASSAARALVLQFQRDQDEHVRAQVILAAENADALLHDLTAASVNDASDLVLRVLRNVEYRRRHR